MASVLILSALLGAATADTMPHWTAPRPNASLPLAGYSRLNVTSTSIVAYGTPEDGAYNHAAMIAYLDGIITLTYKNGIGLAGEDKPGQRVKYAQLSVGAMAWTAPSILFPSMSTDALPIAQFGGPFAVLRGNLYASATPAVIATGDAQGSQFCLWPDGLDPRNAGPPGQQQPVGTLMLRRILPGVGQLGPVFWAATTVPAGFGPAAAAVGILLLNETDSETQGDVATLQHGMATLPCGDPASSGSLKCEACVNGCQEYEHLPAADKLGNERSHWPLSETADAIVYRTKMGALFASLRLNNSGQSAWSAPVLTDIPNDNSNINAGALPDGRVFLLSNPLLGGIRDPLTIALSRDGLDFSVVGVVMTCTDTGFSNSTCGSRNEPKNDVGPSYPQGLTIVPPAPSELQGLWVVATNNKEDVLVAHLAFSALPQTPTW
jgi:hypothetical protein